MNELEDRLRAVRPELPPADARVHDRVLGQLFSVFGTASPKRSRLRWIRTRRRALLAVAGVSAVALSAGVVLQWLPDQPLEISLGGREPGTGSNPAMPDPNDTSHLVPDPQPISPDSPEVPKGLRPIVQNGGSLEFGFEIEPSSLRKRLVAETPAGRIELWTSMARFPTDSTPSDWMPTDHVLTEDAGAGSGGSGRPPDADSIPITVSGSGSIGIPAPKSPVYMEFHGIAAAQVASVELLTSEGSLPGYVGGGRWLAVIDVRAARPRAVIARDARGNEIARARGVMLATEPGRADTAPLPPSPAGPDVPNVQSLAPDAAAARIEAAGFRVRTRVIEDDGLNGANRVVMQSPEPGSAMAEGRTVVLDLTPPAQRAPTELLERVRAASSITAQPGTAKGVRVRVLSFPDDPVPAAVFRRLQDERPVPGIGTPNGPAGPAYTAGDDAALVESGAHVTADPAPRESVVLWAPAQETAAAEIAKRLGISKGASMGDLPSDLVQGAQVIVVLGTRPLNLS